MFSSQHKLPPRRLKTAGHPGGVQCAAGWMNRIANQGNFHPGRHLLAANVQRAIRDDEIN
jgi:hypothetical protein